MIKEFQRINKRLTTNYDNGCWEWIGSCDKRVPGKLAYARLTFNGKSNVGHRVMYEIFFGEIPKNLIVMHKCDNPKCMNPYHLQLGTHQDNSDDKCAKGRQGKRESHGMAKLTEKQVSEIMESNLTRTELGKIYGVSQQHISRLKLKQRWSK